jgi:hypothetical protein
VVRFSLLLFMLASSGLAQIAFHDVDIVRRGSVVGRIRFTGTAGFGIEVAAPAAGASSPYRLKWPIDPPPSSGGYLYSPDAAAQLEWRTPSGGGGGSYTFAPPLAESLGNVTCPGCMRNNDSGANLPVGNINIGSTGNWFNAMYSGTFQVPVPGCADSAYVSATALFGGWVFVKNSACAVTAELNNNGVNIGPAAAYRVNGTQIIDSGRNAVFNNVTIQGVCTGCPGGGGGGGTVTNVFATTPIQSTGGVTPTISCPTCLRTDLTMIPNFNVDLGSASNWWRNVFSGTFQVSVGPTCTASARMSATALFGGEVYVRDSGCTPTVFLNNQGLVLPQQASLSGTRFLCINTVGRVTSSPTPCSGT